MSFVSVRNLRHSYGDQVVLERVNLEVEREAFCTIVGLSGCGKSTFLRMLLSQEQPTSGEILIDGAPIAPEPGPDRVDGRGRCGVRRSGPGGRGGRTAGRTVGHVLRHGPSASRAGERRATTREREAPAGA